MEIGPWVHESIEKQGDGAGQLEKLNLNLVILLTLIRNYWFVIKEIVKNPKSQEHGCDLRWNKIVHSVESHCGFPFNVLL